MNGRPLALAAAAVVLVAVGVSIWLDPPAENRARAFDEIRVQRLSYLKVAIAAYFAGHKTLPARLDRLRSQMNSWAQTDWHDPATGRPFEYNVLGKNNYQLCAVFERNSANEEKSLYGFFHHAGRNCFDNQEPSSQVRSFFYGFEQGTAITGEAVNPSPSH